ncbi:MULTISPECIES: hypothetical protein [Streptomyces]|uniref:hypothetical protein n=1 Tax=Streptomyces TaxID=1883 RepID=UPI00099E4BE4|nr:MULTISPECIES: hypothetical protein [Streptomyces]MDI5908830.1 hypothetical protein [Streptomyces sp. 12257]
MEACVAASGRWTDDEEGRRRLPAGEVHVTWSDTIPESGGASDRVRRLGPRGASVAGRRGGDARPRWYRTDPGP